LAVRSPLAEAARFTLSTAHTGALNALVSAGEHVAGDAHAPGAGLSSRPVPPRTNIASGTAEAARRKNRESGIAG
jgi:hypothetical protein